MRIVGMAVPSSSNRKYRSSPVISGILTSAITQEMRLSSDERKNSTADGKVSAANPVARISPLMASRTCSSSSTIAIRGGLFGTLQSNTAGTPGGTTVIAFFAETWAITLRLEERHNRRDYTNVDA